MSSNLNINVSNFATYNARESQSSPQKYECQYNIISIKSEV